MYPCVVQAICAAQEAYTKVSQFKGFYKPKNHFATHAPIHTLRGGPMREYWCYSYESFHQRVKRISRNSNWKNVAKRCMRYWCHQWAHVASCPDARERSRLTGIA